MKKFEGLMKSEIRHYLDRKRHRPANSMKIEVVDTVTMDTVNEYEIRRGF